jgi:hypothetical protein
MLDLIHEAKREARKYFPDCAFRIERHDDPEIPSDSCLMLTIVSGINDSDISWELFRQFRWNWWLENLQRANRKLLIDLI